MTHVKFNRGFNNLVDDLLTDFPVLFKNDVQPQWKAVVPVNIVETDKGHSLEIVAPGFEKADFKINVDQNVLTISAEKKETLKDEKAKQIRREYSFRSFKRSFTLDETTDAAGIEATYVNGVLTLNLPKKEIVKPAAQEINIK